jgi:hypothetical protein
MATIAERRAALAEERAALRVENRSALASMRTEQRFWVLPEQVRNVSLILFDLTQASTEPVVVYLEGIARQRRWPSRTAEDMRHLVEDLFFDATSSDAGLQSLAGLTDVASPTDAAAMQIAIRRALEWQVVAWAREKNEKIGLAPSTDNMLQRAEHQRMSVHASSRPPQRGASTEGRNRKWCARLRVRFHGRVGKFKVREVIPLAEMRQKAPLVIKAGSRLKT